MFCFYFVSLIFLIEFSLILTQESVSKKQCSCCQECPLSLGESCGGDSRFPRECGKGLICYAPDSVFDDPGYCIKYQPPQRCKAYIEANCSEPCRGIFLCLDQLPAPECSCCPKCY